MVRVGILGPLLSISLLVCAPSCAPSSAAAAEDAADELEPASKTTFGERLLLFMEHPQLVRGVPARFLAHLTVLESGEPVRAGSVVLELGSTRFAVDAPKRDGLFVPEGGPPEAGTFAARLVVRSEQAQETLDLGAIVVHASEAEAAATARASDVEEPPDAIPFLLEQQWKVKLLLARAGARKVDERITVPARAATPEGSSALASLSIGGRLSAPASGALPRTGERVEAGQTLAFVEPALGAAELAELHALELALDLRTLEVLQAAGEAEVRVRFAARERERIATLRAEGLGTESQLQEVEQRLAMATTERDVAARMQASLERLVAQRDGTQERQPGLPMRFAIHAPIAGTVVEVSAVPGESVAPGAPVFRIVDGSRIWIEGRVSEFDAPVLHGASRAVARFAALPGRELDLRGESDRPFVGAEVDPASRTLLVRYEIENPEGAVRPGMLAELDVVTGEHEARVAIPSAAVVMDEGLPTAYVMLEGELFQARDLELGTQGDGWVEVLRGIEPGERVATRGAYLVKLAALSPASFGAGHAH